MMATLTILLSAASLYALAVTALLSVALYGNADVAGELRGERKRNDQQRREFGRKSRAFARREQRLLDDLDFATARLAVLEARGLPGIAEIRAQRTFYSIDGMS